MTVSLWKTAAVGFCSIVMAITASAQSIIRDAEIESILREWTDPILEVAGLPPEDVKLYIINDPSLNAFVANGQRIHLHTGLLITAETPDQIRGVIGHETCHIACGHSVSRRRAAEIASRPALLSIGLGILAIAAGEGQAGAALISSSQQFAALNFYTHTRAEEATADAAAVEYLTKLGVSPIGIVEFFDKFRYQEVLSEARREPYFRSHPLAADRVRTTRSLVERSGMADVEPTKRVQKQYDMMRAKLIGYLETPNKVRRHYPESDTSMPARYARAHAQLKSSDIGAALENAESLLAEEPNNPYFHELKGFILFEAGRASDAVDPNRRAMELAPGSALLTTSFARALLERNAPGDLQTAELALRDALDIEPDNAFAYTQLAIALEAQNKRAEAQLATAEAAYHIGDIVKANSFARRAVQDLERDTPAFRRADDILLITDPSNPDNQAYYRRSQRRISPALAERDMRFGDFSRIPH